MGGALFVRHRQPRSSFPSAGSGCAVRPFILSVTPSLQFAHRRVGLLSRTRISPLAGDPLSVNRELQHSRRGAAKRADGHKAVADQTRGSPIVHPRKASTSLASIASRHVRAHRSPGLLGAVPPRGLARPARQPPPLLPLRRPHRRLQGWIAGGVRVASWPSFGSAWARSFIPASPCQEARWTRKISGA